MNTVAYLYIDYLWKNTQETDNCGFLLGIEIAKRVWKETLKFYMHTCLPIFQNRLTKQKKEAPNLFEHISLCHLPKYFVCIVVFETRGQKISEGNKSVASEHVSTYVLGEGGKWQELGGFRVL